MFPWKRHRAGGHEMDMTSGPLLPKILAFSGPLILTGILQLLYNAADVIVVGNYAGHEALAAVSSTGSLINLLVNVFMGLSVGASVVIARKYGARDIIGMRKAEHTAMTVALFMGIGVGAFGFFMARPMLQWMDSPEGGCRWIPDPGRLCIPAGPQTGQTDPDSGCRKYSGHGSAAFHRRLHG